MKEVQLRVAITLDQATVASLVELLRQAIDQGTVRCTHATPDATKRSREDEPAAPAVKRTPVKASQHALFGSQKPPEDRGLLIDTREAAKLLQVCEKTVWTMYTTGKMPAPIRIGRAVRWGYEELRAWVAAGCPSQEEWDSPAKETR